MLGDPADAQDATQEILLRVARGLATYRGESALTTWAYRVASNHLLTARQRRAESMGLSFEALGGMLDQGLALSADGPEPADEVLPRVRELERQPAFAAPSAVAEGMRQVVASGAFRVLAE